MGQGEKAEEVSGEQLSCERKVEPTLSLPAMSEDAYGQKILEFLLENPQDDGCIQIVFSDRSGARGERRFFRSWANPQAAPDSARTLAEHIDRNRKRWERAILTIRDLPPPK